MKMILSFLFYDKSPSLKSPSSKSRTEMNFVEWSWGQIMEPNKDKQTNKNKQSFPKYMWYYFKKSTNTLKQTNKKNHCHPTPGISRLLYLENN